MEGAAQRHLVGRRASESAAGMQPSLRRGGAVHSHSLLLELAAERRRKLALQQSAATMIPQRKSFFKKRAGAGAAAPQHTQTANRFGFYFNSFE